MSSSEKQILKDIVEKAAWEGLSYYLLHYTNSNSCDLSPSHPLRKAWKDFEKSYAEINKILQPYFDEMEQEV